MHTQKIIFFILLITLVLGFTSCKGVKIKHGKDCGCGSFGQIENTQDSLQ